MRKKKIDFKKYRNMCEETELVGKDGVKISVRDHIPYEEKINLCRDIIENCVMVHDNSCCYENINIHAERIKAIMKYYTNVPVDDAEATDVCDFAINNGLLGPIREYIHDDFYELEDVYITMMNMVIDTYTDDMSLKKAIKTSFGFLFNGEDVTESMAKAELTKDTIFKALDALQKKEQEESEKIDNGKLTVSGKILNFAKKKE